MDNNKVLYFFCEAMGADTVAVVGKDKRLCVCNARYMVWMYMHYAAGMSANKIGRMFRRERSGIFRGIRIIKHNMKYDESLRRTYNKVCEKLEGAASATPSAGM